MLVTKESRHVRIRSINYLSCFLPAMRPHTKGILIWQKLSKNKRDMPILIGTFIICNCFMIAWTVSSFGPMNVHQYLRNSYTNFRWQCIYETLYVLKLSFCHARLISFRPSYGWQDHLVKQLIFKLPGTCISAIHEF